MLIRSHMLGGFSLRPHAPVALSEAQGSPSSRNDGNEIIVTATKRDASLQDVPFSINAQTEQAIERANASTIEDLSRNVAGLTVQNLRSEEHTSELQQLMRISYALFCLKKKNIKYH